MKVTEMLVVSLRGVNCRSWSHVRCSGQKANIFTHTGIAKGSLRADVSYFLPPAEKGRLRNGVANRVPVSCCSGFKFRINYNNRVLFSMPESFPSDRSMIGGRTGLRGGI